MKRGLLIILVAVVAIVGGLTLYNRADDDKAQKNRKFRRFTDSPVPVVVGKVEKKDFPVFLNGIGTVQAFNTVTVRARVNGELQKVAFTEGQDVAKGDLLAVIDPRAYQAELDQAIAKKAQDEAQLNSAKVLLQRNILLRQRNVLDQQTLDTQKYLVDQLTATVQADTAAIDNAKTQLSYTTIVAPISGRIGVRMIDEGNLVRDSDENGLLIITQLKPISVLFTLPEQNLAAIKQNLGGDPLKVFALDRSNAQSLGEGELAVLDNQIDQQTGTLKLKATFANNDLNLWPGQFVNARLLVNTRHDSLCVPAPVIQRGPDGPFAYVVTSENTAEMRPVKVGPTENGVTLIEEGLKENERVVVDGQYRLQPGSKIEAVEPIKRAGIEKQSADPTPGGGKTKATASTGGESDRVRKAE